MVWRRSSDASKYVMGIDYAYGKDESVTVVHRVPEPPPVLRFTIPGEPVPEQTRALVNGHVVRKGRERPRAYRDHVALHTMLHVSRTGWNYDLDAKYELRVRFYVSNARVVDLDNLLKPLLDGLKGKALPDDRIRNLPRVTAEGEIDENRPRAEIELWRMEK